MFNKIRYYYNKDKKTFVYKVLYKIMRNKKISKIIPSKVWLKVEFRINLNRSLNLTHPQTINEKLQWLKLHDRNSDYTDLVDKFKVRQHIANTIGNEYLIPLLGVYGCYDEIDFDELPNQFVLKPNHTSGNVYICKDKSKINYEELKEKVNQWLKREYYWVHREWPYKNINPCLLCEQFMVDESGSELKDYKIMCFNGNPKIIQVISGRKKDNYYINHFDLNWKPLDISRKKYKENNNRIKKPNNLDKMITMSKVLSKNIPFARIDFYNINNRVYFGEITLFPVSGYMDFEGEQYDYLLGEWLSLPIES